MTKSQFWKTSAGKRLCQMLNEYGDKDQNNIGFHTENDGSDGVWIEITFPHMRANIDSTELERAKVSNAK